MREVLVPDTEEVVGVREVVNEVTNPQVFINNLLLRPLNIQYYWTLWVFLI